MTKTFYSNGKLLLTAEYLVLDGAKALAIPTRFGQSMVVMPWDQNELVWTSLDHDNKIWYENCFTLQDGRPDSQQKDETTQTLLKLLRSCQDMNNEFLTDQTGYLVISKLDFPNDWGLGSSSTLVNNLANWADVDAYALLKRSFGGSGYDIACAQHRTPISYQIQDDFPKVEPVHIAYEFTDRLYFVHLNKKENSRRAIASYKQLGGQATSKIEQINHLTEKFINCSSFDEFCDLITTHETTLSELLQTSTVQSKLFDDFKGCIKSLGAWGGDFVLVASELDPRDYFKSKGYVTVLNFDDMILN